MSISCSYSGFDKECGWFYNVDDNFKPMPITKNRRRCFSCYNPIEPNSQVLEVERWESDYEDNDTPLPSKYLCEERGEIYLNLSAIGFRVDIDRDLHKDLKEY